MGISYRDSLIARYSALGEIDGSTYNIYNQQASSRALQVLPDRLVAVASRADCSVRPQHVVEVLSALCVSARPGRRAVFERTARSPGATRSPSAPAASSSWGSFSNPVLLARGPEFFSFPSLGFCGELVHMLVAAQVSTCRGAVVDSDIADQTYHWNLEVFFMFKYPKRCVVVALPQLVITIVVVVPQASSSALDSFQRFGGG